MEGLDDETARAVAATKQRLFDKAAPAALRICAYLARNRPNYFYSLVEQDNISYEDFEELMHYNGISTERYEG